MHKLAQVCSRLPPGNTAAWHVTASSTARDWVLASGLWVGVTRASPIPVHQTLPCRAYPLIGRPLFSGWMVRTWEAERREEPQDGRSLGPPRGTSPVPLNALHQREINLKLHAQCASCWKLGVSVPAGGRPCPPHETAFHSALCSAASFSLLNTHPYLSTLATDNSVCQLEKIIASQSVCQWQVTHEASHNG